MNDHKYKENDLFRYAGPYHLNACVGKNGGPYTFYAYSLGYFNAAKTLVNAIKENPNGVDLAVYPIIYNYRHAIELALKHFASVLSEFVDEPPPRIGKAHELTDVWEIVRSRMKRFDDFSEKGDISASYVDKIINDIRYFDPKAQVFRFPVDLKGNTHLQDTAHINILVFANSMEEIKEIFETWFTICSALIEWKIENRTAKIQQHGSSF